MKIIKNKKKYIQKFMHIKPKIYYKNKINKKNISIKFIQNNHIQRQNFQKYSDIRKKLQKKEKIQKNKNKKIEQIYIKFLIQIRDQIVKSLNELLNIQI